MSKLFSLSVIIFFFSSISYSQTVKGPLGENFSYRVVADKLSDPWEIVLDPEGYLWVTEAKGYRLVRINPVDGSKTVLLDLNNSKNFDRNTVAPQGGLMGLAIHPKLLNSKPFVYLAYVYNFLGSQSNDGGTFFKTKIVRYMVNFTTRSLVNPVTICDTIPGSNDHNGGRLLIAPVGGVDYLFYAVGDMGAGQFNNGGRTNNAQNPGVYEGKILRFNLEPDQDPNISDKAIPNDNPFNGSRQSAVYTLGHRNPQGLAYATIAGNPRIYSVEHGPFSDDEINIIERKRNYGHPLVIGMNDGNYSGLSAATTSNTSLPGIWQTSCPVINDEITNAANIGSDFKPPIKTLYPSSNNYLRTILTAVKNDNSSTGYPNANSDTWQSEATSSVEVYTQNGIPGWKNSLLIPTLKGGKLIRLKLNSAGDGIEGDTLNYFKAVNRYRDVAISPDGLKIYLAVDSSLITSAPSASNIQVSVNRGSILEFTYTGSSANKVAKELIVTNEREANKSSVYPNPANNIITITLNNSSVQRTKYSLFNMSGRILAKGTSDKKNFGVSVKNLNAGMYILKVYDVKGESVGSFRVVKE